jgi:hypothetical protein
MANITDDPNRSNTGAAKGSSNCNRGSTSCFGERLRFVGHIQLAAAQVETNARLFLFLGK